MMSSGNEFEVTRVGLFAPRPTEAKYKSINCCGDLTRSFSRSCQNQPGRIETSHSAGRQTVPFRSPLLSCFSMPSWPG